MKHPLFARRLSALAVLAAFTPAFADNTPEPVETVELETIKVVGSINKLQGVPFRQAKSAVDISAETLKTEGVEKADELGRYQAGFTNQPYGSDTNTNWFRVRATETSQSFDGAPAVAHGFFQPTVETYGLESVEITKGADALTYGASNAGGLINFISKRPHADQTGKGEVQAHIGTRGQRGIAADYTGKITADNSLRYRLVGSFRQTDGEWKGTENDTAYFAPSLAWDITDRTKLSLLASYQKDKGTPSSNFLPIAGSLIALDGQKIGRRSNLGDPSVDRESNKQYALGYEFSHDFSDGLSFSSNYRYNRVKNNHLGLYVWPSVNPADYTATRDAVINNGTATGHSTDNRLTWRFKNDVLNNTLVAGIDYRNQKTEGVYQNYGIPSPVTPSSVNVFAPTYGSSVNTAGVPQTDMKTQQTGFYVQNSARLFNKVGITAGVRHDRAKSEEVQTGQSVKANHTSYSGSLMYFAPFGISPYFAYSESFRLPSGLNGNQKLYDPAATEQYEAGVKYLPSWLDGSVSLAAFKARDKGALVSNANGLGSTVNGDTSKRKGVELQAQAQITDNISGQLAYTYQSRVDHAADGNAYRNPLFAKHSASLRGAYSFDSGALNGLSLGAGVRYVGKSRIDGQWASFKGAKVPSSTVFDLFARYDFADNWTAQVNVDNVADRNYLAACDGSYCYAGQGRSVSGKVSYKF